MFGTCQYFSRPPQGAHATWEAFEHAAEHVLEECPAKQHRPWISRCTLHLIDLRSTARAEGNYDEVDTSSNIWLPYMVHLTQNKLISINFIT